MSDPGEVMPIAFMRPGEGGTLVELRGLKHRIGDAGRALGDKNKRFFRSDRGHRLEHRLNNMGLVPGAALKVVQNNAPGPIILAVKDSRLCLGRAIAGKIMVRPEAPDSPNEPAD